DFGSVRLLICTRIQCGILGSGTLIVICGVSSPIPGGCDRRERCFRATCDVEAECGHRFRSDVDELRWRTRNESCLACSRCRIAGGRSIYVRRNPHLRQSRRHHEHRMRYATERCPTCGSAIITNREVIAASEKPPAPPTYCLAGKPGNHH